MVKSKEELLEAVRTKLGEDTSDEAIALIEDITDTYADMETRVNSAGDWKRKYEENDASWRTKYKERFYSNEEQEQEHEEEMREEFAPKTFDDLFTVKGD